jgi:hypothetical protein
MFNRLSEQLIAQRLIRRIDHEVIDRRAIDPKDKKKGANRSSLLNSNLNLNYYFLITRMVMFELLLLRFTK